MTPTEVDELDAETYQAFVRFQNKDAQETQAAINAAKKGR